MRLGVKWYLAAGMVAGAVGTILAGMVWASSATPVTDRPVPGIEQRLPPPERENRTEVVSLGGAASVRIEVELGAGTLSLGGGSVAGSGAPLGPGQLLRGAFLGAGDPPDVSYRVDDGRVGHLRLTQRETGTGLPRRDQLDAWQLYLNPTVPTHLRLAVGAGTSRLTLGGLSLTGIEVATGVGDTTLDLSGDWQRDLSGRVEGTVGNLTLRLPRQIGVRIAATGAGTVDTGGLRWRDGAYVNDAFGRSPVTIDLAVEHGAGALALELAD